MGGRRMTLTAEQVQKDLDNLPQRYKTPDVDCLIRRYVKQKANVSELRPYILTHQQFHRIYFYVSLEQIKEADRRMSFIHENLLFSDWWHTDQLIRYVRDLDFAYSNAVCKGVYPFRRSVYSPLGICTVHFKIVQGT